MIADTNSVIDLAYNSLNGIVSGNWVFLGIIMFIIIGYALVLGKAKASTVVMVGVSMSFIFIMAAVPEFQFLFWIAIVGAMFVLTNGLRKWITGQ